ncbi:MAG: class I SAM-dependent methyltransferase [Rhodospirillales bacterium]|nr:class I SAM-dependent methyltransferase [Rhodospirillales bacterium]
MTANTAPQQETTSSYNRQAARTQLGGNLRELLAERFLLIGKFVKLGDRVLEVGAGTGLAYDYYPDVELVQTDAEWNPWLDAVASADALPFPDASFDKITCFLVLHHLPYPKKALAEFSRVLKPGGMAVILESCNSTLLRFLLSLRVHEYVDAAVDPFGDETCQRGEDNWDGNNAIGRLLFDDAKRFARECPEFTIVHRRYSECLSFINSGGVNHKSPYIPLPGFAMRMLIRLDKLLCALAPGLFALSYEVVLRRN